jgi:hypothetical protein
VFRKHAAALLGSREEIIAGKLDPMRILARFGVGIHEVAMPSTPAAA